MLRQRTFLKTHSRQAFLSLISEQKFAIQISDRPNHWVPPVKPQGVLRGTEPAKVLVEIVTEIVAAAEHQKRQYGRKVDCLGSVVVIDNEPVDEAAHGPAHAERAKDERPENLVHEIARPGHDEDTDCQEDELGEKGVEVE